MSVCFLFSSRTNDKKLKTASELETYCYRAVLVQMNKKLKTVVRACMELASSSVLSVLSAFPQQIRAFDSYSHLTSPTSTILSPTPQPPKCNSHHSSPHATILSLTATTIATPITRRDHPALSLSAQLALADTSADRIALLPDPSSFLFNFDVNRGKGGLGGDITLANRKTFPALVGTRSSMAVGFLGPCGFNTPHVHLRGTELQVVTQGTIHTEMIVENGVFTTAGDAKSGRRLIQNDLGASQMTVFYQGSVHTQYNTGCNAAMFVASFNSEDLGTGSVADELFALSEVVVIAAFGQAVDGAQVDDFKGKIPASIAKGVEQCLTDCKIAKRSVSA
ncbi:hypothetical protein ACLOAV_005893 [Pseudogymnoascus australis]